MIFEPVSLIANVGAAQSLLRQIAQSSIPTPEEETEWLKRAQDGDEDALTKLILGHGKFIVKVVKKYASNQLHFSDLFSEALIGFIHSVRTYDFNRNVKFLTYAGWWLRQKMSRYASNHGTLIRIPESILTAQSKIRQANNKIYQIHGIPPSEEDLSELTELSDSTVTLAEKTHLSTFTTCKQDDEDVDVLDMIKGSFDLEYEMELSDMKEHLYEAIAELPETDQQILNMYFGLNQQPCSKQQISEQLNISEESIRGRLKKLYKILRKRLE